MKWEMTHTKRSREMTTKAAYEIANRIVSYFLFQWSIFIITTVVCKLMQYFFTIGFPWRTVSTGQLFAHRCQDVLTAAIGQPEHSGRVRAAKVNVTINQYFGLTSRSSCTSTSMTPEDLE